MQNEYLFFRVETLDFKAFPFKPLLCRAPTLPRPLLCCASLYPTLTPTGGPRHHFLFLGQRATSLPWPTPICTSLPRPNTAQEGHFLLCGLHTLPLSMCHTSLLHVAPLSYLWSCQKTKNMTHILGRPATNKKKSIYFAEQIHRVRLEHEFHEPGLKQTGSYTHP